MGWLYIDTPHNDLATWLQHDVLGDGAHYTLVDGAEHAGAFYAAVRRRSDELTFGLVVLLDRTPTRLGYKLLTEETGPAATGCPGHILDQLSPLDELFPPEHDTVHLTPNAWATQWRESCRAAAPTP